MKAPDPAHLSPLDTQVLSAAQETWRVFRIMSEFGESFAALYDVGPAVSIFGSARTPPQHPFYRQAEELAAKLAQRGFAVITGGGPGIMEAANRGARLAGGKSVGLNIALPHEQVPNPYQNIKLDFHYFFVRKVMFVKYAIAFVCFPGGFGTLDEFFELLTLMQTDKVPDMRVVLIGSSYWNPLRQWMRTTLLEQNGYIAPADLDIMSVTDDIDQAVHLLELHRDVAIAAERAAEATPDTAGQLTPEGTRYGVRPHARGGQPPPPAPAAQKPTQ